MALIGLVGRKRSGKDTFASRLTQQHGYRRLAFADPLKAAALQLDPLVKVEADEVFLLADAVGNRAISTLWRLSALVELIGWEGAKEMREVRRTLQQYGVAIRELDPGFWLRQVADPAVELMRAGTSVVVTDVRFPNEADAIEELGGELVRVVRPGLPDDGDTHVSETALDDRATAYTLTNDDTVEKLWRAADFVALLA